jgi:hypothetical protein
MLPVGMTLAAALIARQHLSERSFPRGLKRNIVNES